MHKEVKSGVTEWRDEGKAGAQRRGCALTHIRANRVNLGQ